MDTIRLVIRRAAWLSILIVLLVTLVPIGLRPATGLSPNIERFCAMAAVGALFALAYPRRFWLIVLTLSLTAAIVEPLQSLAAGRHPSFGCRVQSTGRGDRRSRGLCDRLGHRLDRALNPPGARAHITGLGRFAGNP